MEGWGGGEWSTGGGGRRGGAGGTSQSLMVLEQTPVVSRDALVRFATSNL